MRYLLLLSLLFWSLFPSYAAAQAGSPADSSVTLQFTEGSELVVEGSSNVRAWTMDVAGFEGEARAEAADGALPSLQRIEVTVPVEALRSDRSSMQEKAHKALKKEEHPDISFEASDIDVSRAQGESFGIFATGELTIAGTTRSVEVQGTGSRQADGSYRIQGDHEISLSNFDVEPPSALLGTLTVDDEVRVDFDVTVAPE